MRLASDVRSRLVRVRAHGYRVLQCAAGAGLALYLAREVVGHAQPIFAPIAAVVALGVSYGQRLRRVVEVVVGVAIGVFVGDALVRVFGSGVWQVALVVALGMTIAIFLRAGPLMINQAAIQGVFVTLLLPTTGAGLERWEDAAVGGAVALALAALAPAGPLRRPLAMAAALLSTVADLLWQAAAAAREHDVDSAHGALEAARGTQGRLDALRSAAAEGLAVATLNPLRRRGAAAVRGVEELSVPLDRAVRNVRVLARRLALATEREEPLPGELLDLVDALAAAALRLGEDLGAARSLEGAVEALADVGERSARVPRSTLSADVVLAQVRSTAVDLLEVAGLDDGEAHARVPSHQQSDPQPQPRPEGGGAGGGG